MENEIGKAKIKEIKNALIKKAVGYYADEIVEEYALEDGKEVLIKKKITKKFVPGDMNASKMLLEYFNEPSSSYENLSDAELDQEAIRLFKEYQKLTTIDMAKEIKEEDIEES